MSDEYRRRMEFALRSRWRAEIARCQAGLCLYMDHPAGVGDHPNVIGELDRLWGELVTAQEKLDALTKIDLGSGFEYRRDWDCDGGGK